MVRWTVDPRDYEIATAYGDPNVAADILYDRVINGWLNVNQPLPILGQPIPQLAPVFRDVVGATSVGSYGIRSNSDNLLLHSLYPSTVLALPRITDWVRSKGYTFDLLAPAWQ